jgi:hypothetical protein
MGKTFQLTCALSLLFASTGCSGGSGDDNTATPGSGGSGSAGTGSGGNASAGKNAGSAGSAGKAGGTGVPGKPGEVGGCQMFPAEDAWNLDVAGVAADATWTKKVQDLVGTAKIHPDYGVDGQDLYGIPLNVVPETQPLAPVSFDDYPE